MQVPPDLASRLSSLALSSGSSPEAFLREAISRLIESSLDLTPRPDQMVSRQSAGNPMHTCFVPQAQSFSVYE
jgi:predicted transcriptional regulator